MGTGNSPAVFVSSTCYDLAQIRLEIKTFIESLGMVAYLSESHAFPVNTQLDAVANCLLNVEKVADVLVLIIGGRYGSTTVEGKSVTNLEYLEAKAKNIPVYVFIQKSILNVLPVWGKNKHANFSDIVDSKQLFAFIDEIRNANRDWTFAFESAHDIISTLRVQLGYLVKESLDARATLLGLASRFHGLALSSRAVRLLVHRPQAWKYLFFGQILSEELYKHHQLRRDLKYSVRLGEYCFISDPQEVTKWIHQQMDNIQIVAESLSNVLNSALQDYLNCEDDNVDIVGLVYVANRFGLLYRRLLEWVGKFNLVKTDEIFSNVLNLVSKAPLDICTAAEKYPDRIRNEIEKALASEKTKKRQVVNISFVMDLPAEFLPSILQEFRKIEEFYSSKS